MMTGICDLGALYRTVRYVVTYSLRSPFAVFYSEQIVREAQIVSEFFQKVYAEAGAALIEAAVLIGCCSVHSGILKHAITWST